MNRYFKKIQNLLGSRVARNIYLWVIMLYFVIEQNINNEKAYHYGIIHSRWYYLVLIVGTLLQMTLLYGNNLLLVPRLLARKKYLLYFSAAFLLIALISVIYTIGLKTATAHINVDHLQQIGFVSSPITREWSWNAIYYETQTYLVGNIMWVFIFTMAWYMNDYQRQQKVAEEAKRHQATTELNFLKSQLNPHFLFNTLNNLYALTLKKSDRAPDAILKLSSILRYLLYESNTDVVSFEKEQEMMQAYIDLELLRIRDKERLKFTITSDRAYNVPPLLWLPVLENIFKHGTRIIDDGSFVVYSYTISDHHIRISSRNTYKASAAAKPDGGIGLSNLKKRLDLLYPGAYTFVSEVKDNEYITEVNIEHL